VSVRVRISMEGSLKSLSALRQAQGYGACKTIVKKPQC
jgi:hypothetical protein